MKNLITLLCCFGYLSVFGQYNPTAPTSGDVDLPRQLATTITSEELREHLQIIASADFEGRETGTEGQKKAASYIAGIFKAYGLPAIGDDASYFQKISFIAENWEDIKLTIKGEEIKHLWDFYAFPTDNGSLELTQFDEVVFLGYGIEDEKYSDYKNADVRGKAVLIYDGEPVGKNKISLVTGTTEPSEWSLDVRKKLQLAKEKGVKTVFIIDPDFKQNVSQARKLILNRRLEMGWSEDPAENYANSIYISSGLAKKMIGDKYQQVIKARKKMRKRGKSKPVKLESDLSLMMGKNTKQLLGENVLGYIEGTDPKLKDELVVITAHYDHLGKRGDAIYYGADDNGSGTSTVLEVCQAFVEAKNQGKGARRSVLVMLVSGEEKGLLGSEYYVANPVFSLENTVANVNVDMVGRVDDKHAENPNYIYVIGSDRLSSELHEINETANATYTQLELDYTYNAKNDPNRYYYRSDHYNFAERGIPAIFYFNGTHDDYHRTSDTVDKINFEKMETIARLVFYTAWELSNRDKRIEVDRR